MDIYKGIICILVFAIIFTIDRSIKYYKHKKLFELVAWSVIGDYDPVLNCYSYTNHLMFSIAQAQSIDSISDQYKIVEDEDLKLVREIVKEYQDYIAKLYFRNKLKAPKSKYDIPERDYFIAMLHDFLSLNSEKPEFLGHNMYCKRAREGNGTKCVLSDYGILFYKLYYITYMYCKESPIYQKRAVKWAEERIKNILDTKQI